MSGSLPGSIPIDSVVASLVGRTFLTEDAIIKDATDKKIDSALRKVYSGSHLALRAGIYCSYVSQILLTDIKKFFSAVDDSSDCSSLLDNIEKQVEFMSNIVFDVVCTSVLNGGACIVARRNVIQKNGRTDAAQKSSALRLPFQGSKIFGSEFEDCMHKLLNQSGLDKVILQKHYFFH
ncbi:hypothetical protein NDU88_003354 [Pleurodeles waltl]|uniref:Lamina-associated polypeptide 2 alpha C-terminal domain-containing protein n=1 Tax=Pleurodeles waltl TaxID=8319 RepID=A0AAV7M8J8_PLEWA|nr:hypothetical protein NDU88_003354 [Pleurodeles waltl]